MGGNKGELAAKSGSDLQQCIKLGHGTLTL